MVWISSSISASISWLRADDDQPAVVANEVRQVVPLQHCGKCQEHGRFGGIVDMGFDLAARLGAQLAHQAVQHAERFEVVALLRRCLAEGFHAGLAAVLHGRHRIGDEEGSEGRAADDDGFPGLDQDVDMAAHGHEAAKHAAHRHHKPDQYAHEQSFRIPAYRKGNTGRALCEA
jgi:hypothetical protein